MYAMYDIKEYNTQENTNTIPVLLDFKDKFRLYLDYYKDEE